MMLYFIQSNISLETVMFQTHLASLVCPLPTVELGVHLDPSELGVHLDPSESIALRWWWLGLDTSGGLPCPLCSDIALDPLGHYAATCRRGDDVGLRHNHLRDTFVEFCHQAI